MSAAQAGKETMRTLLFVGAAVASLLLAYTTRPVKVVETVDTQAGKPLFEDFNDSAAANGLEVLRYDEDLGRLRQFQVAKQEQGIWALPSHQNYPADAQARLVNAATMFVDLKVIRTVSDKEGDHETFGVVEPSPETTRVGDQGVGMLVRVLGEPNGMQETLAELIIGNPVKGLPGQHYVRRPGKSNIYQVEIDPSQLSTRFQDWIETDLLNLDVRYLSGLTRKDYSVEIQQGEQNVLYADQRLEIDIDIRDGQWHLESLQEATPQGLRPATMEPGEELNTDRLNTLVTALDDLKIVDVERKPNGLGADLRADKDFLADQASLASLAQRGFYPVPQQDGGFELWSSDGELLIDTIEGVRYVLRFGRIAGMGDASSQSPTAADERPGLNRYLFVTALVNESQFPPPDLEPLPEAAEQLDLGGDTADQDTEVSEQETSPPDPELIRTVERITRANQRKIEQREALIEAARKKVAELTYRFADWYYIVPEDVFKKLRLRRRDLITVSEEALQAGTGIAAFRHLEEELRSRVRPPSRENQTTPPGVIRVPVPAWRDGSQP